MRPLRRTTLAILGASALTLAGAATAVAAPAQHPAEQAALDFTTNALGFTEIDQIKDSDLGDAEARVTVGYDEGISATLHLWKDPELGEWEVLNTENDGFTIESPGLDELISPPTDVSGLISGVDESIVVQVHQHPHGGIIGATDGLPAGGEDSPWETTVDFCATSPPVYVVAWTGGHVQTVERFAVQRAVADTSQFCATKP